MRKSRILGFVLASILSIVPVVAVRADTGPLDHVVISPAEAMVATNGTQQFTATGQDAANLTVSGVTFTWAVVAGGGTVDNTTGLFTAGNVTGTFNGTVQVTAIQGNVTKTANASVTITAAEQNEIEHGTPPGWSKGEKKGWDGEETPPGWSKGGKKGWDGEDAPPGFSKGEKNGWDKEEAPAASARGGRGRGRD